MCPLPAGEEKPRAGKVAELFVYSNFVRTPVDEVEAGDICALTGLANVGIGETLCDPSAPNPLPTIEVGAAYLCVGGVRVCVWGWVHIAARVE